MSDLGDAFDAIDAGFRAVSNQRKDFLARLRVVVEEIEESEVPQNTNVLDYCNGIIDAVNLIRAAFPELEEK